MMLMKMKRVMAFMVLSLTAAFLWANSDIQGQIGRTVISGEVEDYDDDLDEKGWGFAFTNYNLFNLDRSGAVSLGFVDGLFLSRFSSEPKAFSGTTLYELDCTYTNLNVVFGPALGLQLGNVIKIQGDFGFSAGAIGADYDSYFYYNGYKLDIASDGETEFSYGFSTGVQLKIAPASPISPVGGFRYFYTMSEINDLDITVRLFYGYFGISLNFGDW